MQAYCMKTKQKEEVKDAKIIKNKRGGFMIQGVTAEGHKVSGILSEANATKAIEAGEATKAY